MRCGAVLRAPALHASAPWLLFGLKSFWSHGKGRGGGTTGADAVRQRRAAAASFLQQAAAGLGGNVAGNDFYPNLHSNPDHALGQGPSQGGLSPSPHRSSPADPDKEAPSSGGGIQAHLRSATQEDGIDALLLDRAGQLRGGGRLPLTYEIEARQRAQREAERARQREEVRSAHYDEWNMPRRPDDPARPRAEWEFTPTPEHKSLILLLYRNVLKGLVGFKSVRKRSLIAYARFAFRRRAMATEKLLIDECVEECRRAIYVIEKHHNFTRTRTYEFDTMTMPKDTGQDVRSYMEDVYDPEISRMQFQNFTDVQPGKEHLHKQGLGPASGSNHWRKQKSLGQYGVEIREEDKTLRPPPPPGMSD